MPQVIQETVTQQSPTAVVTKSTTLDTPAQTIIYLVYFFSGVLEILLLFRFLLKATGANPGSGFVSFTYGVTQFFTWPFRGIFPAASTQGAVTTAIFEPSTLVAMVVYAAIAWGVVQLVMILSRQSE
jgi:hypothetical protein